MNNPFAVAVTPEMALAIKNVVSLRSELSNTFIYDLEAYNDVVSRFTATVKQLGTEHRNWNPLSGEPDGMVDYSMDDQLPKHWRVAQVPREDLTTVEELIEDVIYYAQMSQLENPSISTLGNVEQLYNALSDIATYHPNYSDRNGEINED